MRKAPTTAQLARKAIALTLAYKCDSREFEDCFEWCNSNAVVAAFVAEHDRNPHLRQATRSNHRHINLEAWRATAAAFAAPLFTLPA